VRILVTNWNDRENPHGGGAEVHLHETFGRIASLGHRVELLASGWKGCAPRTTLDGIDVHRVGTRFSFALAARRYYDAHLASGRHDVLVEDLNKVPLHTPRWGPSRVVPLVHHLFGTTAFREAILPMASAVWLAERTIPRTYRGLPFVSVSESTAEDLVLRGVPREDIKVIYNGVDSAFFSPEPAVRSSLPLFSYVGRLKRYKGVDLVLRAFARVVNSSARLEIAGAGDHRPQLERLARSLGVESRVAFVGFISAEGKRDLLRRSWASVFASPKEGWGLTNLESAAAGTPVIASDSPGLRESLIDGETGMLVRHGDVAALAAAMEQLAGSRDTIERLGIAGRRFAERFTWERTAEDTLSHLESTVQRGKNRWR